VFCETVNSEKDDVASPVNVLVYSHKNIGRLQLASEPWLIVCTQRAYDMHLGISRPWPMCMASGIECYVFACVALTGLQAQVV
jgi:hypothetical protein